MKPIFNKYFIMKLIFEIATKNRYHLNIFTHFNIPDKEVQKKTAGENS